MSCRLVKRYMGGSTSFNGTTSTIPTDITSNDVFTSGNGFTLWRWIKPKSYGEIAGRIFDKTTNAATADGFRVVLGSSYSIEFNINGGTQRDSAARAIKINQWTLALVTVAPDATVTHYINGVVSGTPGTTGALSGITTANPLTIGNRSTATDSTFDGLMGEGGIVPRVLTQAEITALYTAGILPADTAHFFPLSDLPSTYLDTIGGATGTGTATTYSPDVPVQLPVMVDEGARSSLSFDGVNDSINVFGDNAYTLPAEYTYTTKLKLRALTGASQRLLSMRNTVTTTIHTGLGISSSGLFEITHRDNTTDEYGITTKVCRLNDFVTVSLRKSSTKLSLHIAGQKVYEKNSTVSLAGSLARVDIGKIATSATQFFSGLKKNEILHEVALTDQQIRDLHFNNIVPYKDDPTKLVLNLELNEGAGTTAYDSSGNGNDGTITGATWSAVVPSKAREVIGGNLVLNGDFELPLSSAGDDIVRTTDGNVGGIHTKTSPNPYVFGTAGGWSAKYDTTKKYQGARSLKLSFTNTTASQVKALLGDDPVGYMPVKPSTQYTLTAMVSTLNAATDSACVQVIFYTSTNTFAGSGATTNKLSGTNDWTEVSVTFTTTATTRRIYVYEQMIVAGNVSDAWFDKIKLVETVPTGRATATTRTTVTCP